MRKIILACAILVLAIVGSLANTESASAAKQYQWNHSGASSLGSLRTYSGYFCNGTRDITPRGTESEVDVGSVRVPKGYSLWKVTPSGVHRYAGPLYTKSRCYSYAINMVSFGNTYWAVRPGKYWGKG